MVINYVFIFIFTNKIVGAFKFDDVDHEFLFPFDTLGFFDGFVSLFDLLVETIC